MYSFVSNFSAFIYPLFLLFALLLAIFLFWRACRHEFFDSHEAFDFIMIGGLGALAGARILDFIIRIPTEGFSLLRLLLFNSYGGFYFWGALVGIYIALFMFLKNKKTKLWFVLDLFAAPVAFAQALVSLGSFFEDIVVGNDEFISLYYFLIYLFLFVVLKRLSTKKKHIGFFASFYLVFVSLLSCASWYFLRPDDIVLGVHYQLIIPAVFLVVSIINWYFISKRKVNKDLKGTLGFILLSLFRTKRIILSTNEAGNLSKSIIFSPYFLLKLILRGFFLLGREVKLSFFELLYVFGLRKFFK